MRVSVTLTDDVNKLITEHAKNKGVSKDKLIAGIIDEWLSGGVGSTSRHNERGAGRKKQFGDAHKLAMRAHRANGMSYREIAKIYGCSAGIVHKLINEQD